MIHFESDYTEGAIPSIIARLAETNLEQTTGYGVDDYCGKAAQLIRSECRCEGAAVHFVVGGTQANKLCIASVLRPHQGVIAATTGHINVHEAGAIENTGHKVLAVPAPDGKLTAAQVDALCQAHKDDEAYEHAVQPAMLYISSPTEVGTQYSLSELTELRVVCDKWGIPLFLDGARMGYALAAAGNDVWLPDFARLCDMFYIGGTKVGALFGEAIVIPNVALQRDFRYIIKLHGAMLAKGRLLGLQFEELFSNDTYVKVAGHAVRLADRLRKALRESEIEVLYGGGANQIFAVMPHPLIERLETEFSFSHIADCENGSAVMRICTSWATQVSAVDRLVQALSRCE